MFGVMAGCSSKFFGKRFISSQEYFSTGEAMVRMDDSKEAPDPMINGIEAAKILSLIPNFINS
jgi:hypothetical protein